MKLCLTTFCFPWPHACPMPRLQSQTWTFLLSLAVLSPLGPQLPHQGQGLGHLALWRAHLTPALPHKRMEGCLVIVHLHLTPPAAITNRWVYWSESFRSLLLCWCKFHSSGIRWHSYCVWLPIYTESHSSQLESTDVYKLTEYRTYTCWNC